jgi:hypothetical protein
MTVSIQQLNDWATTLSQEISNTQEEISLLEAKLTELQRKRTAIEYLTGTTNDGHHDVDPAEGGKSPIPPRSARTTASGFGDHAPYTAYWAPILEVLTDLGNKGHVEEVLRKLKQKMHSKGLFGPHDYQDVPSGTEERWRNTARWQRKAMVDRGLLRSGSPRGIWEITEEGSRWLERQKSGGNNGGEGRSLRQM